MGVDAQPGNCDSETSVLHRPFSLITSRGTGGLLLNAMDIFKILDRPIAFHRCFVDVGGSIKAALFLGQAFYWTPRTAEVEGWFFKTQKEWQEETGLNRNEQETARKQLKERGLLEEKLIGIPATLHYKINAENLLKSLGLLGVQTSLPESSKLECEKSANSYATKSHTGMPESSKLKGKTTSESTTETTSRNKVFASPSEVEAKNHAVSLGMSEDEGLKFWLYHQSKGWVVGKSSMKDWKAALRTWQENGKKWKKERTDYSTDPFSDPRNNAAYQDEQHRLRQLQPRPAPVPFKP